MRGASRRSALLGGTIAITAALVVCEGARGDPPPPPAPATADAAAHDAEARARTAGANSLAATPWAPTPAIVDALEVGDLARARELLERAPGSPGRDFVLGRVLAELGEPAAAARALGRVGDALPELDELRLSALAEAQLGAGDAAGAARTAADLLKRHPNSRRAGRARVLRSRAVAKTGPPAQAIRLLSEVLDGPSAVPGVDRPSLRYLLARAREASGDPAGAAREYRRIAVQAPEHRTAGEALAAVRRLEPDRPLAASERMSRAERLLDRRRYEGVLSELEELGDGAEGVRETRRTWLRAVALYRKRGRYDEAATLLAKVAKTGGPEAEEAAFLHARALSRLRKNGEAAKALARFAKRYPTSDHADEARFLGLTLELEGGRRAAPAQLLGFAAATKDASLASQARFRAALAHLSANRARAATPALDAIAGDAAASGADRTRATYWTAFSRLPAAGATDRRAAAKQAAAGAIFARLVADEPLSWYGLLARQRLSALGKAPAPPFGRRVAPDPEPAARAVTAPTPMAETLLSLGLLRDAEAEISRTLEGLSREDQIALWQRARATERLHDLGRSTFGADLGRPPVGDARRAWAFAYPRPYRALVEAEAAAADVPPTLVWAVMRQESSFDADVVSVADARGLMQLLPTTAARVAQELGTPFTEDQLDVPLHNVRLGTRYLGALLRRYRGQAVLAIAAYNGGPHAVDSWLDAFGDRPTDEFVERIPFDQTRNYVRRVTSAWARYRYLYDGTGDWPFEVPLTLVRERGGGPDY